MNYGLGRTIRFFVAVALVAVFSASEASASWGSHGSGGGSWGSSRGFGSSGGSWGTSRGSYFGSRGGPIRNLIARIRSRHAAGFGSSGGSSGGRWQSLGSRGSFGSSGGSRGYVSRNWGSSGGGSMGRPGGGWASTGYSYYSASSGGGGSASFAPITAGSINYSVPSYYNDTGVLPGDSQFPEGTILDGPALDGFDQFNSAPFEGGSIIDSTPPPPVSPLDNGGGSIDDPGPNQTQVLPNSGETDTALLNLQVPSSAVVYVNGKRTTTPGTFRTFASRNLKPGKTYSYEVKAEMQRDGKLVSRTRIIQLTAGANKTFNMEFEREKTEMVTSVTLFVPYDAKVNLGGVETSAEGSMRYFSTQHLKAGQSWQDYRVVVTVERDGKLIRREKTVDVNAGDSVNLRFDFDQDQVAVR